MVVGGGGRAAVVFGRAAVVVGDGRRAAVEVLPVEGDAEDLLVDYGERTSAYTMPNTREEKRKSKRETGY